MHNMNCVHVVLVSRCLSFAYTFMQVFNVFLYLVVLNILFILAYALFVDLMYSALLRCTLMCGAFFRGLNVTAIYFVTQNAVESILLCTVCKI